MTEIFWRKNKHMSRMDDETLAIKMSININLNNL